MLLWLLVAGRRQTESAPDDGGDVGQVVDGCGVGGMVAADQDSWHSVAGVLAVALLFQVAVVTGQDEQPLGIIPSAQ